TRSAAAPPAALNAPPAKSAGPLPSSNSARAAVQPFVPVSPPSADQTAPSQRAIFLTMVEPAPTKKPPTYSAAPLPRPSSKTSSALPTLPRMPEPSADQFAPSQRAMQLN